MSDVQCFTEEYLRRDGIFVLQVSDLPIPNTPTFNLSTLVDG